MDEQRIRTKLGFMADRLADLGVKSLSLFGSSATGKATGDSDLDFLAVSSAWRAVLAALAPNQDRTASKPGKGLSITVLPPPTADIVKIWCIADTDVILATIGNPNSEGSETYSEFELSIKSLSPRSREKKD